jgi:hypothetical protein
LPDCSVLPLESVSVSDYVHVHVHVHVSEEPPGRQQTPGFFFEKGSVSVLAVLAPWRFKSPSVDKACLDRFVSGDLRD